MRNILLCIFAVLGLSALCQSVPLQSDVQEESVQVVTLNLSPRQLVDPDNLFAELYANEGFKTAFDKDAVVTVVAVDTGDLSENGDNGKDGVRTRRPQHHHHHGHHGGWGGNYGGGWGGNYNGGWGGNYNGGWGGNNGWGNNYGRLY